ncbi:collagenase-like [Maniola jurtina]|uniref:collagenase-like n=1 Tax=Maniola jurtina TaxID=191418 RepID=UPI001E68AF14|nr:collagenase-like [Maniola jurtina]
MDVDLVMQTVNMKLLLVFVGLAAAASAEYAGIWKDYHEEFGIAEAARIKQAEQSMDFDGARIVGGSGSNLGQHPHLGGLIVGLTNGRESVCGSSLLSNTRLVTAAHCWRHGGSQGRTVTVVLGSLRLFSGGHRVASTNVQLHASYSESTLNNDIAIIVIGWVGYSNNIRNINIASGTNTFAGNTAMASGFGRQGDNQGITQNQSLRHVTMQVITNQACANVYGSRVVVASVICTATTGGRGVCSGDSGGPLDVGTGGNRQLIGVTSFVHASGCERGQPAGFARVSSFNAWIRQRL